MDDGSSEKRARYTKVSFRYFVRVMFNRVMHVAASGGCDPHGECCKCVIILYAESFPLSFEFAHTPCNCRHLQRLLSLHKLSLTPDTIMLCALLCQKPFHSNVDSRRYFCKRRRGASIVSERSSRCWRRGNSWAMVAESHRT